MSLSCEILTQPSRTGLPAARTRIHSPRSSKIVTLVPRSSGAITLTLVDGPARSRASNANTAVRTTTGGGAGAGATTACTTGAGGGADINPMTRG